MVLLLDFADLHFSYSVALNEIVDYIFEIHEA